MQNSNNDPKERENLAHEEENENSTQQSNDDGGLEDNPVQRGLTGESDEEEGGGDLAGNAAGSTED
ncbi:hypothetical protein DHW03_02670 [Pedobacter yonginense]|uniref:Uncharacterized protein n=1 Tax=Pedobacter yonginense TaxID=651869 RepID=A0A317ESC4_9SPHI|nr:hypothetical protein [Pedobacter yonginense]PWS28763.1 hypothetical protein DHW03_02670 [Pedobacter yonginense]